MTAIYLSLNPIKNLIYYFQTAAMVKTAVLFFSICIVGLFAWDNNYLQTLFKVCPSGTAVTRVVSTHSNFLNDRRFRFDCNPIPGGWHVNCQWQGFENNLFGPLISYCPWGKVMRGVYSSFQNGDRRWFIYCCRSVERTLSNCRSSYPGTGLELGFIFQRPNSYVIGIVGFYDPPTRDRRFHFGYCNVSPPFFDNFASGSSAYNATVVRALLFEPEDESEPEPPTNNTGKDHGTHGKANRRY